ncbi:MAG: DUF2382 domain-containing protein [Kofleriaceae bacterium]|nr:DUF2382 domain-containing protein [Kofleriaceae bacterium]
MALEHHRADEIHAHRPRRSSPHKWELDHNSDDLRGWSVVDREGHRLGVVTHMFADSETGNLSDIEIEGGRRFSAHDLMCGDHYLTLTPEARVAAESKARPLVTAPTPDPEPARPVVAPPTAGPTMPTPTMALEREREQALAARIETRRAAAAAAISEERRDSEQRTRGNEQSVAFDQNIELYEEDLSAVKRLHDAGEVRLHKRVVTTPKTISVPVMHEEVVVERVQHERPEPSKLCATTSKFDELNVALCEEELAADKITRPLGEVRIHKRVVTTHKQITVPVMHEEIRVEHVPAGERKAVPYAKTMFVEDTRTIPLRDEEVELRRVPYIREGVHLQKTAHQDERTATADLRREELDIEQPERQAATVAEGARREFVDEIQTIPLYEEDIELRRYPVVREEVRVSRAAIQEERTFDSDTSREELDIEQPTSAFEARKERLRGKPPIIS